MAVETQAVASGRTLPRLQWGAVIAGVLLALAAHIVLGLVGAFVGYLIFTRLLGVGDDDAFDLGGLISAIIGVIIVLLIAGWAMGNRRVHHA